MKNNRDNFDAMIGRFKGDGPYLRDGEVILIDAASGTFNLPFGYTHPRLTNKLKEQIERCAHLSSAYTKPMAENILAQLKPYLPVGINRIWLRDVSGSGAVEGAIRISRDACRSQRLAVM